MNIFFVNVCKIAAQGVVCMLLLAVSLSCSKDEPDSGYIVVPFDNSKLALGTPDGRLRLEIYNAAGSTASDPGLDVANFAFANEVSVTFTLSDIPFTVHPDELPVGYLTASIFFANSGGSVSGNGPSITVTGEGTYTVVFAPGTAVTDVRVFLIDIVNLGLILYDDSTTATIDKIQVR